MAMSAADVRNLMLEIMTVWSKRVDQLLLIDHDLAYAMSNKLHSLVYISGVFQDNISQDPQNHQTIIENVLPIITDIVAEIVDVHDRSRIIEQLLE
jgi:hypothetical protein